jgi:hypothetical protein
MKKITVLILVLGLAVPAQAWTLFPVREKIVEVQKTNYVVTAGACVITLAMTLALSLIVFRSKLSDFQYNSAFTEGNNFLFDEINKYFHRFGLSCGFVSEIDDWSLTFFESPDHTEPDDAQRMVLPSVMTAFVKWLRDDIEETKERKGESTATE